MGEREVGERDKWEGASTRLDLGWYDGSPERDDFGNHGSEVKGGG